MASLREVPWYADGLRFSCTQCGNCCSGPPGAVWFTEEEAARMAPELGLTVEEFYDRHARRLDGRWSLKEVRTEQGHDCVLLKRDASSKKALCSVYRSRPLQCRTWPFWSENLRSLHDYVAVARTCPGTAAGLRGKGRFSSLDRIARLRDGDGTVSEPLSSPFRP